MHYPDGVIFYFEGYTCLGQYDDIVRMIITTANESSGTILTIGQKTVSKEGSQYITVHIEC